MIHLRRIDDLADSQVDDLLDRAEALSARRDQVSVSADGPVVSLVFLTPSMRTRVGFEIAARRLGGAGVHVSELRVDTGMSAAEGLSDALRVLGGMSDAVVVRTTEALTTEVTARVPVPVVSGGDAVEHPTQALIDLAAIRRVGDPADLHIALCGDLRMRAATSLLRLFARRPPGRLSGIHPPGRGPTVPLTELSLDAVGSVDVLVMVGLAPGRGADHLDDAQRRAYALTGKRLDALPGGAVVLSPMPVIDEMDDAVRDDPRVRMFEQSDHGLFVRMAVLEHAIRSGDLRP